jgi:hypothetical protein
MRSGASRAKMCEATTRLKAPPVGQKIKLSKIDAAEAQLKKCAVCLLSGKMNPT